jgi:hypothetical protein
LTPLVPGTPRLGKLVSAHIDIARWSLRIFQLQTPINLDSSIRQSHPCPLFQFPRGPP